MSQTISARTLTLQYQIPAMQPAASTDRFRSRMVHILRFLLERTLVGPHTKHLVTPGTLLEVAVLRWAVTLSEGGEIVWKDLATEDWRNNEAENRSAWVLVITNAPRRTPVTSTDTLCHSYS